MTARVPPRFTVPAVVGRAVAALSNVAGIPPTGTADTKTFTAEDGGIIFAQDLRLILREREIYRAAIMQAREAFDRYAGLHRDKTPPDQVKAEANHQLAVCMANALELAEI